MEVGCFFTAAAVEKTAGTGVAGIAKYSFARTLSFLYRPSLFLHHCNGLFLHHCSGLSWGGGLRFAVEERPRPLLWWGRWRSGAGGGVTRDGVRTVPLSFKFSNWQ